LTKRLTTRSVDELGDLAKGINRFIDSTVSSIGASNVLTVSKTSTSDATSTDPQKYDPDAIATAQTNPGRPGTSNSVSALTDADITAL
ncbi:HAMP domain-containing protein, partial [Enterococcus faecium]